MKFLTLLTLAASVLADVSISNHNLGQTINVSGSTGSVDLTWIESNASPLLTAIDSYTFSLCTGSNANIKCFDSSAKVVKSSAISDYSYTFDFDASLGSDGPYYVQIYSTTTDGYTIHYSSRFTLSGMSGSVTPSGTDASPPEAQTSLTGGTKTLAASALSASFALPYTAQTGLTRYAPMQLQPGTSVTASTWTRQFPTSAVTYYTSMSTSLAQHSTLTPGWSYTISSAVNWASAALQPSENGGWYNPASKVKSASLLKAASTTKLTTATTTTEPTSSS